MISEAEAADRLSKSFGKFWLMPSHLWVRGVTKCSHFQSREILICGVYVTLSDVKPQIVEIGLSKRGPTERRHYSLRPVSAKRLRPSCLILSKSTMRPGSPHCMDVNGGPELFGNFVDFRLTIFQVGKRIADERFVVGKATAGQLFAHEFIDWI